MTAETGEDEAADHPVRRATDSDGGEEGGGLIHDVAIIRSPLIPDNPPQRSPGTNPSIR